MDTSVPFVIIIKFYDDEYPGKQTKTYIGAFGQYWLYSHLFHVKTGSYSIEKTVVKEHDGIPEESIRTANEYNMDLRKTCFPTFQNVQNTPHASKPKDATEPT